MIKTEWKKVDEQRAEIWVDGELWNAVHLKLISSWPQETFEDLDHLLQHFHELARQGALKIACRLLEKRSRHSQELKDKWNAYGVSESIQAEVEKDLEKLGYLDNETWTKQVVARELRQGHGPAWVRKKLASKGIFFEEAHYSDAEENAAIERFLERPAHQKLLEERKGQNKLCQMLLRRGFSQDKVLRYCKVNT